MHCPAVVGQLIQFIVPSLRVLIQLLLTQGENLRKMKQITLLDVSMYTRRWSAYFIGHTFYTSFVCLCVGTLLEGAFREVEGQTLD